MLEKLKWKLIEWLAGDMPIVLNVAINGKGIKKGWCVFHNDPNYKMAIMSDLTRIDKDGVEC